MSDYSNIGAVCFDCARNAGFTPKKKTGGVWVGECDICKRRKPCTDLWHDWMLTKKKGKKGKRGWKMSAFCDLCYKDPYTGELLCVRLGKWVERCPNFPDGYTRE